MAYNPTELKIMRRIRNLNQKIMAKILKMSYINYNLKENGKRPFSLEDIDKLKKNEEVLLTNPEILTIFFND